MRAANPRTGIGKYKFIRKCCVSVCLKARSRSYKSRWSLKLFQLECWRWNQWPTLFVLCFIRDQLEPLLIRLLGERNETVYFWNPCPALILIGIVWALSSVSEAQFPRRRHLSPSRNTRLKFIISIPRSGSTCVPHICWDAVNYWKRPSSASVSTLHLSSGMLLQLYGTELKIKDLTELWAEIGITNAENKNVEWWSNTETAVNITDGRWIILHSFRYPENRIRCGYQNHGNQRQQQNYSGSINEPVKALHDQHVLYAE